MFNYTGHVCDVCGETFDKNSDVVVCPDCGTPHHRHCWQDLGHCINQEKHIHNFEWIAPKKETDENSILCPDCGAVMPKETMFCESCGKALQSKVASSPTQNAPNSFMGAAKEDLNARVERELAGELDGVAVKDIAIYIGPSAQYYIYKFKRMAAQAKYRPFCWTAFLFSPLYFLYRKMWKIAILSGLFNFVMNIPTLILSAVQMGLISSSSPLLFSGIESVAAVTSILVLVMGIFLGFMAVPLFKNKVISDLKLIKSQCSDQETYYRAVLSKSGPSKFALLVITFFVISYFFNLFL